MRKMNASRPRHLLAAALLVASCADAHSSIVPPSGNVNSVFLTFETPQRFTAGLAENYTIACGEDAPARFEDNGVLEPAGVAQQDFGYLSSPQTMDVWRAHALLPTGRCQAEVFDDGGERAGVVAFNVVEGVTNRPYLVFDFSGPPAISDVSVQVQARSDTDLVTYELKCVGTFQCDPFDTAQGRFVLEQIPTVGVASAIGKRWTTRFAGLGNARWDLALKALDADGNIQCTSVYRFTTSNDFPVTQVRAVMPCDEER